MSGVLITSVGRRVALVRAFREALAAVGGGRVVAADVSRSAAALHEADAGFCVPPCDSPEYVPALIDICRHEDAVLVVPTTDREQPAIAAGRAAFAAAGVLLAASGNPTVVIAADKCATARFFAREGIPSPRVFDLERALAGTDDVRFPVVLKPRFGSGSIGVQTVTDVEALRFYARRVPHPLLQEHVAGDEYTLDVLVSPEGRAVCVVPRRRLEIRAGEIAKGYTVHDEALEWWGRRIAERLPEAFGPLTLQCFRRPDGSLAFIEVNARFGGGFPLAWRAGADFARWLLEWALGLPSTATVGWREHIAMLRYDDALFVPREALA